ncbi:hypothetical protein [Pontimicrobium sp. SW4]|uniref:Outer membrane protein beta-barrel domain-containing protein n=1 Tax=Pontimicrobium sp. SW4 TaxID=3153519 RepID=A0AAU7BWM9_9FLAO
MKKDRIEEVYGELEMFSKVPPKELWNEIETRLHPKKKKRRVLFLWGSAAAVLVMLLGYMAINLLEFNSKPIQKITDTELPENNDIINESNEKNTKIVKGVNIGDTNKDSLNIVTSQQQLTDRNGVLEKKEERKNSFYKKSIKDKEQNPNYNESYSQNILKKKIDKVANEDISDLQSKNKNVTNYDKEKLIASNDSISKMKDASLLGSSENLVAKNENTSDSINTNALASSKWLVEILGGLSNTVSKSSIQGTTVSTTSQENFVYAFKVGYSISDRLVVKSGIGKNILGQEINNIKYVSSDTSPLVGDYQSIVNNQTIIFLVSQEIVNDFSSHVGVISEGTFQQQFDYIQVPLEFSYNLINEQKYNVSLGVGGNLNFLTKNKTFLNNEQIGESLGVNHTIFGATLNSNISYKLAKEMILFLEPSYNYFDKPIDNNNNQIFNNTQLRVLFGLRYKL